MAHQLARRIGVAAIGIPATIGLIYLGGWVLVAALAVLGAAALLIVEETADVYAFRHALTREAVYGTLLQRERQQQHRTGSGHRQT